MLKIKYKISLIIFCAVIGSGLAILQYVEKVFAVGTPANPINYVKSANRTGLVGWWTMDSNDVNGTTVYDKSGQGNNGALTGTSNAAGKIKEARSFNGTSAFVNIGNKAIYDFGTNDFTLSAWVKWNGAGNPTYNNIFRKGDANGYLIRLLAGSNVVQSYIAGATLPEIAYPVSSGGWHQVVLWRGSGVGKVYLDGVAVSSIAAAGNVNTGTSAYNLNIGTNRLATDEFFSGSIDDARIFNRALSAQEVANLYSSAKVNYVASAPRTGLVGWWTMDANDRNGTTLYDKSGFRNNGIEVNTPTQTAGKINQAMSFASASAEYVDLFTNSPSTTTLSPTNAVTVSAWVKMTDTTGSYKMIVGSATTALIPDGYNLFWNDSSFSNKFVFTVNAFASNYATAPFSTGVDNKWHHVVGTFDKDAASNQLNIWVDGVKGTPKTYTSPITYKANTIVAIGRAGASDGYYWSGQIDDVRIFNRALSASEVANLYQSAKVNHIL